MFYPIWNIPYLGGALVIAGISILHVVISHFAVGAGIFNVISETYALRKNDPVLLRFIRDNSKFLIYFSFVAGAITGVGIWFSIGLVSPEGTSYLIRLFLWAWAIEWIFFLIELASGYVYYYTWDRLTPRLHLLVGWIYAIAAYLSLVIITGILSFMLTPGVWPITNSFWNAWFNPSFLPSVLIRTVSALSFSGIFVAIVVSTSKRYDHSQKEKIIAWGARFLLPLVFMPLFAIWYFQQIPAAARALAFGGAMAMTFLFMFGVFASLLVVGYAYFGMIRRARDINFATALLMCALAFLATASMEFVREGIRKPYLITDIMYSNGIMVQDVQRLKEEGIQSTFKWIKTDTLRYSREIAIGEAVFRAECLRCHQIEGYNAIIPLVEHWNREITTTALSNLSTIKPFMPPFIGTEDEKQSLIQYLLSLTRQGSLPAIYPDSTASQQPDFEEFVQP